MKNTARPAITELAALERPRVFAAPHAEDPEERRQNVYAAAMAEAMHGSGPFWAPWGTDGWENEQEIAIFKAVRAAVSGIGLDDIERWNLILRAVSLEAGKMAAAKAEATR